MISSNMVNIKVSKQNDPDTNLININYKVGNGLEDIIDSEQQDQE